MSSEKSKKCTKCKTQKPANEFYKDSSRGDGLNNMCKPCSKAKAQPYQKNYSKNYYQKNKSKINEQRKIRYHTNNQHRLAENCRSRIRNLLAGLHRSKRTLDLIGLDSWDQLMSYIENQFTDGMSWDNRDQWHIDHIRPCASFDLTCPIQQSECFHYTNLQPLWAKDNLIKSDNY
jgi:hypothetical protein